MSQPPLKGVRVIELARILAGPWAGQLLADLGADVIKVENPDGGDDTRKWGPPFVMGHDGENLSAAYYHSCNRGKRSIAVDFSTPEGAETVRKLVATADVLIENFKLGGLKKYGLDYESLREAQPAPRLLLDHRLRPGRTLCAARRLRLHHPGHVRHDVDHRRGRRRAAEGRRRGLRHLHRPLFGHRHPGGAAPRRGDRRGPASSTWRCSTRRSRCSATRTSTISSPASRRCRWATPITTSRPTRCCRSTDGHFILAVGNDGQFRKFCAVVGLDDLPADPDFATNAARVANRERCARR